MSDPRPDKSIHVTQQEFYISLSLVWLYIGLIIGEVERTNRSFMTVLLFAAAILMSCIFSVMGFRSFSASKRSKAAHSNRSEP